MQRKIALLFIFLASCLFTAAQLQPADTCLDAYFHRMYLYDNNSNIFSITETHDKKLLWCGDASFTNTGYASDGDALVVKLRNNGTIIWSKFVGGNWFDHFNRARENRDKSIIAVGTTNYSVYPARNMLLSKLDSNGNLLWSRKIDDPNSSNPAMEAVDVAETNDGGYFVCGTSLAGFQEGSIVLLKTDANGNLLWFKELGMGSTYGPTDITGVVLNNDTAYVSGWLIDNFHKDGLLLKVNANSGAMYWSKHYDYKKGTSSTNNIFKNIFIRNDQLRIDMVSENNDPLEAWMINMDYAGNVLKTRKLASPSPESNSDLSTEYPTADDGFISAGSHFTGSAYILNLVKVDANGNLAWSKSYNTTPQHTLFTFVNSNNDIFVAGNETISLPVLQFPAFLVKTDKNGDIPGSPCTNAPFPATVGSGNLSSADVSWQRSGYLTPPGALYNIGSGNNLPTITDECSSLFNCDQVKIVYTSDSICNLKDTLLYSIQKNTGCNLPVSWSIDTAIVSITNVTDSTIHLLFKKAGVAKLSASMISACTTIADSITITAFESPGPVDLGPDIGICKSSEITFNAGNGFKSYRWNDGSTDSTLKVFTPGKYFVTTEDYCSHVYSDTVLVTARTDVPFNLGPDLEKCNNDTLTITAPGNFLTYTWSPAYNNSSSTGSTIKVWPAVDTSYSVMAQVDRGCTVFDTIGITVKNSPPIYLGNDTTLCAHDSLLLQAPGGFASYQWQDGVTTSQTYWAYQKTFYWVVATYGNGCISTDTLEIKNIYPLPVVDLGKDFDICKNETHTFTAGNNFKSWLWQDGSTQSAYSTQAPGIYWVQVTDFNNCTTSDTVTITGLKPAPENFAPANTAICTGKPLSLTTVGTWTSYLWNTNAHTPAITIVEPGDYWLQVTNTAGCTARDTITVASKDCQKGVYFPNAFTPDNNGHNDTYRPVVQGGLLDKFRLIIFNRYGEKVFETTNYLQGWNGIYNGIRQNTNQFVWLCYYQFRGEKEQVQRGTLLLLR